MKHLLSKIVCWVIGHKRHEYYDNGDILSTHIIKIKGKKYIQCQRCNAVLEEEKRSYKR